jgi:hypothetical protein
MRKWYSLAMANTKMWGVTGQEADHPVNLWMEMSWVEVAYKLILTSLKFGAIKNLPEDQTPLFSERDLQQSALTITDQLFSRNGDGNFRYLGEFLEQFGAIAKDRRNFLKGLIVLRKIVTDFLGESQ